MNFDKTKAMRNAEKFLAQGKIRAAIGEYELVVKHDPRDFGTLNMLGDLYIKTSAKAEAVGCYNTVAEHYSTVGFAQKAIAVYNKISKLEPDSVQVSEKLAELYKIKGSIREARSHYVTLAEHYQKTGKTVEALAIWNQIALLDPSNTDVFLNIAQSYLDEGQPNEAIEAYVECGNRFAKQKKHDLALDCFEKALGVQVDHPKALAGFVAAKFALDAPKDAAAKLNELLEEQPTNRDILVLLIDCQLASENIAEAERAVIKLVEQEPANYPKFLELAAIYLRTDDLASAARILSMSSEHMLVGGQANEFNAIVHEILARDPDQLDALRLLVRYCAWQKDEIGFKDALVRLAGIARTMGFPDDERYALSQLTIILPHEIEYADRLKEINREFGYDDEEVGESLFDKQFVNRGPQDKAPADEAATAEDFADGSVEIAIVEDAGVDVETAQAVIEISNGTVIESDPKVVAQAVDQPEPTGSEKLQKEVESIRFYIESGYLELAEKAIHELRGEFGECDELAQLRDYLGGASAGQNGAANGSTPDAGITTGSFDLGELRSELGLEEPDIADNSDYETHYHTAVAYQEMGLIEQSIREFQDAVGLVAPNDGTRRFFQCANLLGHCFMEQGMPKLALKWFNRTLETDGLVDEEKQALWYEIAAAYELDGDTENAAKYFELVYAENVDFRDVRERVRPALVGH